MLPVFSISNTVEWLVLCKTVTGERLLTRVENTEPTASGDPDSPLRWTAKSVRTLAAALHAQGHAVSHALVAELLRDLGYSLQANQKTREGPPHPDRDAQFRYLTERVRAFQRRHQPAISADAKKRELVGDFKNAGRE
jgi:uncharacterized coiled-coil protein SlyX